MFDVGFSEILVILLVALIVIGPERLPQVARTLGRWWGGLQRYVASVKQEVSKSAELAELEQAKREMQRETEDISRSLKQVEHELDFEVRKLQQELEREPQKPADESRKSLP